MLKSIAAGPAGGARVPGSPDAWRLRWGAPGSTLVFVRVIVQRRACAGRPYFTCGGHDPFMELTITPVESEAEWEHAKAIRRRVFIEEQDCPPDEEWDGLDATSRHVLGMVEGTPIATARWRTVAYDEALAAKLERFAVLPDHRGRGYGRQLVDYVLRDAHRAGFERFVLHAQAHLETFYASFGFKRVGAPFSEAGIPHIKMTKYGLTSSSAR